MFKEQYFLRRLLMTIFGVLGVGICVAFFRLSFLGVDPFQSMMSGINALMPNLSFGTLNVIVNGLFLLFALSFDRTKIGLGTFINLILLGYVIDFSYQLLLMHFTDISLAARFVFLMIGVVFMCFNAALYFSANMGVSTYDAVALILAEKFPARPFKIWRIITDSVCIIIGIALFLIAGNEFRQLGAIVGLGTIIAAFFMGPLIGFFIDKVSNPLLNK